MDELSKLIAKGPDQRHVVRAKVLERFGDIKTARDLGHTWPTIARALGLEHGKWKDLSRAFLRVSRSVESGKLRLPSQSKPQTQSKPQATATAMRPLPTVGGNRLIEDEDERRKMLAERGIVFK